MERAAQRARWYGRTYGNANPYYRQQIADALRGVRALGTDPLRNTDGALDDARRAGTMSRVEIVHRDEPLA